MLIALGIVCTRRACPYEKGPGAMVVPVGEVGMFIGRQVWVELEAMDAPSGENERVE